MLQQITHTAVLGPDVELRLSGVIAGTRLPLLAEQLALAMQLRPENLILNTGTCTDIDPDVIRLLLNVCDEARLIGSHIILRHPTPTLTRSLAMAGVLRWLIIDYPDAASAAWTGDGSRSRAF
jgi:anti-anti-sigma regulatory factor